MNNITTFKTSKTLIAAGMPVPDIEVGQFWYQSDGQWFLVYAVNKTGADIVTELGDGWMGQQLNGFIPAFTATDILRELGYCYELKTLTKREGFMNDDFMVFRNIDDGNPKKVFYHANPAEAAALAYLSKNKQ